MTAITSQPAESARMAYRVKADCSIQSTVFGQHEERSFKAGSVTPKSEVEDALLQILCTIGHAEVSDETAVAPKPEASE